MTEDPFSELAGQMYQLTQLLKGLEKKTLREDLTPELMESLISQILFLEKTIYEFGKVNETLIEQTKQQPSSSKEKLDETFLKQLNGLKSEVEVFQKGLEALKTQEENQAPELKEPLLDKPVRKQKKESVKNKYNQFNKKMGGKGWKPL